MKHDIPEQNSVKSKPKNGGSTVNAIGDNNNSGVKDDDGVRLRSRKSLRKEWKANRKKKRNSIRKTVEGEDTLFVSTLSWLYWKMKSYMKQIEQMLKQSFMQKIFSPIV